MRNRKLTFFIEKEIDRYGFPEDTEELLEVVEKSQKEYEKQFNNNDDLIKFINWYNNILKTDVDFKSKEPKQIIDLYNKK